MFRVCFSFLCKDLADSISFAVFVPLHPLMVRALHTSVLTKLFCLCGVPGVVNEFTMYAHRVCLKRVRAELFLLTLMP